MEETMQNNQLESWESYRVKLAGRRNGTETLEEKEARRRAAVDRGEHLDLLHKAERHLKKEEFRLAKNCAREGFQLQKLPELGYILALACSELDEKNEAEQYAQWCMLHCNKEGLSPEGSEGWITLCKILIRCGSYYDGAPWVVSLWENGLLSVLSEEEVKKAAECILQRYYGTHKGFSEELEEEKRKAVYDLLLHLIECHLSEGETSEYPSGNKLSNRAKIKAVCMMVQREEYARARAVADTADPTEVMVSTDDPSLRMYFGKCYFETGDPEKALLYWQGGVSKVVFPLDTVFSMGYGEDYLRCLPKEQTDQRAVLVERTRDFLTGKFPASTYFKDYPGYDYLFRAGINDYIWKENRETDTWSTVPYNSFR